MQANTPSEIYRLFAEYFSAGTIDLLMTLYEDEAVLVAGPGQEARGKASVREALNGFLAMNGEFHVGEMKEVESGGVALLSMKWTLTGGTGPDGQAMDLAGQTSDVARKQEDGSWLLVIDSPFGITSEG